MSFCFNYAVNAQSTEDESMEFSGSVDTYFRTNLSGGDKLDALASLAKLQMGLLLGMVNASRQNKVLLKVGLL